ncbi:Flp pilus assembly protein CpaB [Oleiagrimonas soli]|uniref:Pilus assembly protein CpaB n=1 Tax=Oleiagrimonas soli TaxID=1543381 RepID=A0A099CYX4_9GAMM|nr:Flp pilus assembly protein CpaB [Oleiagrimonas soli]KGI78939.1 pilus assembly protein CpaB [Oleiagrimonas soli]MBB6184557.1 pilus assembly protein CpaB [Oleiagrimonas soli]
MAKINRNFIFLGVAVLLGVLASLLAVHYVNTQVAKRTHTAPQQTVKVVVPVRDLAKGDTLTARDVAARDVPADFVPADAVTPSDYHAYLGQVLRAPLQHGAPIPASAVERLSDHFSNIIGRGKVAYTIQVDDTNSISGLITPGDHIDLMLLTSSNGNDRIRPLLGDVLVLATGQHAKGVRGASEDDHYSNLTLELAPEEAQRIGIARKVGALRVMLRRPGSDAPFNLKLLSKADLLRMQRRGSGSGIQFIIGGNG